MFNNATTIMEITAVPIYFDGEGLPPTNTNVPKNINLLDNARVQVNTIINVQQDKGRYFWSNVTPKPLPQDPAYHLTACYAAYQTSFMAQYYINKLSPSLSFTMPQILMLPYVGPWGDVNAFYTQQEVSGGEIRDFIVLPVVIQGANKVRYVCASFDIVAHETGHCVFHYLAQKVKASSVDRGIDEFFGDFMKILHMTNQTRAAQVFDKCILNPREVNLGVGYGDDSDFVRSLLNATTMADHNITCEEHDKSQPMAAMATDLLKDRLEQRVDPQHCDPMNLCYAADEVVCLVLGAFLCHPPSFSSPQEFADGLIASCKRHFPNNLVMLQQVEARISNRKLRDPAVCSIRHRT